MERNFSVEFINASQIAAVETLSKCLKKGVAVQVTTYKETKMNKTNNPFIGRVFERAIIGGWVVGTNYSKSCQNAAKKSGSDEDFKAKENWHTYYNDFFETDKKTSAKYYLQLQKSAQSGSKITKTYYIDGIEATDEEVNAIQNYLPNKHKTQSSSQVEAGIKEERERDYILIDLANIESIKQGEFVFNAIKKEKEAKAEVTR